MQAATKRLALIYPASGEKVVCSALAWPDVLPNPSLLRAHMGANIDIVATTIVNEGQREKAPSPVLSKVLDILRFAIELRVKDLGHPAIEVEMRTTEANAAERWLRVVGHGVKGDGTLTLIVNVQHHLAYQALAVALLHAPASGFKVHKEDLRYAIQFADTFPLVKKVREARAKRGLVGAIETQLILTSFVEIAFRGAGQTGATFKPTLPGTASKTRWYVALEGDEERNPLSKPAPKSELWPEGAYVYTTAEGRFVLSLLATKAMAPVVKVQEKPKTPEEEERWIMIDDFGTLVRRK